jgi:hypothetical protein
MNSASSSTSFSSISFLLLLLVTTLTSSSHASFDDASGSEGEDDIITFPSSGFGPGVPVLITYNTTLQFQIQVPMNITKLDSNGTFFPHPNPF